MKSGIRILSISALALVSAFAAASPFIAVSSGTYDNSGAPVSYTSTETVISAVAAPFPAPTTLDFAADYINPMNNSLGVTNGVATYKNGLDELKLSFSGGPFSLTSSTSSISGSWSFLSGTGAYAGILAGSGTWSASYSTTSTFSQTTFVGEFRAVPEPATMAVLAMGLAGVAARRRRK